MHLDSARELKSNLVALARSRTVALLARASRQLGVAARPLRPSGPLTPRTGVAFGVAPMGGSARGYRLAVRIMNRGAGWARSILRQVPGLTEREIEWVEGVRYRPRARTGRRPAGASQLLRAGGSCGHPRITAGTLGGFVEDARRYYALSNNHVLADCDSGRAGDPIWQPGQIGRAS